MDYSGKYRAWPFLAVAGIAAAAPSVLGQRAAGARAASDMSFAEFKKGINGFRRTGDKTNRGWQWTGFVEDKYIRIMGIGTFIQHYMVDDVDRATGNQHDSVKQFNATLAAPFKGQRANGLR